MKKSVAIILFLLGIAMIYIGGLHTDKIMLPPIITGIGFFAIAILFLQEK